jgi:hypothetical protein
MRDKNTKIWTDGSLLEYNLTDDEEEEAEGESEALKDFPLPPRAKR